MNGSPLVELADVSFSYGDRAVIDRVDLVIGERELLGIVGPSGSGKTTLLRTIMGRLAPTSGAVRRRGSLRSGTCRSSRR